jgi:hypothetical protein
MPLFVLLIVAALLGWATLGLGLVSQQSLPQATRADSTASRLVQYHQASAAYLVLHKTTTSGLISPAQLEFDDPAFNPAPFASYAENGALFSYVLRGHGIDPQAPGFVNVVSTVGMHVCLLRNDGSGYADCPDRVSRPLPSAVVQSINPGDVVIAGDLP